MLCTPLQISVDGRVLSDIVVALIWVNIVESWEIEDPQDCEQLIFSTYLMKK